MSSLVNIRGIPPAKMTETTSPAEHGLQQFRFMDLPPEVRSMIFKEIFIMPRPVHHETDVYRRWIVPETKAINQANLIKLFLVSDTFWRETLPIYFGKNSFTFDGLTTCREFLEKIGPDARCEVRNSRYPATTLSVDLLHPSFVTSK